MGTVSRSYQKAYVLKVRSAANEHPEGGSPDLGEQTPEQGKASRWALPRPPSIAPLSRRFEERHAWYRITMIAARKLGQNLVPILMVQAMGDAALFVLHRLCHRLTNEVALRMAYTPELAAAIAHSPWYLVNDASAVSETGYQRISLAIFALSFAFNVLIKAWAALCTLGLCQDDMDSPAKNGLWRGMRVSLARVRETAGRYKGCWRAVWAVEMLVAALVIPLQFASALLVTLPLTLPIMLELQAASPAALFERRGTWGALMRSRQLVRRVRWPLALPFLAGIVLQRLSLLGRDHVLGMLPPRLFVDVVEIPIIIFVGGAVLSVLLLRFQDVLPYAAYAESTRREREEAAADAGDTPQ
ncbi:hypothetical protein QBZ16_003850 [Prototheca wickerhamii]|uniref:Uncharacterized protein n=1 Tax=Prototheca wickerhamii TaxID=3111 RepID=A0AAD9IL51_PROWI|nr:hypothetical protein QBZ16_003850 [Prototheca wickerhamii]